MYVNFKQLKKMFITALHTAINAIVINYTLMSNTMNIKKVFLLRKIFKIEKYAKISL